MFKFIEPRNGNGEILAITNEQASASLNLRDSYGDYSQQISDYDAGSTITLDSEELINAANDFCDNEKSYNLGDWIDAYNDQELFDYLYDNFNVDVESETIGGFNYHDGDNWRTVVLFAADDCYVQYDLIDDELLEKELNAVIENKIFESEGPGYKTWVSDDDKYSITRSYFTRDFEQYKIERL